jgi:hypothetical protein
MSTISEVEASKLLQKEQNKMQECSRCKEAGFPNKLIGFEKILLGVKEYGNHSNRYNRRAENVTSTVRFF